MLKNSVIIDILKDCNSFNLTQWNNTSSTSDIEFNVFFIYSNNPNKFEIVDYFNESKKSFNLISNQGFKEFKKYLSINAVHALFIYGNKQTKQDCPPYPERFGYHLPEADPKDTWHSGLSECGEKQPRP